MYELGDVVRPSESFLKWQRKRAVLLNASSVGVVVGFKAPVLMHGEHVGVVIVKWAMGDHGLLYQTVPMRWDQIRK